LNIHTTPPKKTPQTGFTFELCAGLVDKGGKSLAEVAAEEVEEECGYRIPASKLRAVSAAVSSSGTSGAVHHIFFGVVRCFAYIAFFCGLGVCLPGCWLRLLFRALSTHKRWACAALPCLKNNSNSPTNQPTNQQTQSLQKTKVDEPLRSGPGGGIHGHGEAIEVLALPFDNANAFALDAALPKSPGLMFGLVWARQALATGEVAGRKGGALETQGLELRPVLPS
jgi:hypothetical protein